MTSYGSNFATFSAVSTTVLLVIVAGLTLGTWVRRLKVPHLSAVLFATIFLDLILLGAQVTGSQTLIGDARAWHALGALASEYLTGRSANSVSYVEGKEGYIWILGTLYSLSGPAPLVAVFFGISCHLWATVAVASSGDMLAKAADISQELRSQVVLTSACLLCLLPCFGWWAPQVLRESLTLALIATAVYLTLSMFVLRHLWPIIPLALSLTLLIWVRGGLGAVISTALLIGVLYVVVGRSRYRALFRFAILATAVVVFPWAQPRLSAVFDTVADSAGATTAELSSIATSGFPGLAAQVDLITLLGVTAPRVLFGPFVWEFAPTGVMILAVAELSCWLFVFLLSLKGARRFRSGQVMTGAAWLLPILFIALAALLLGLMMTVGNYGILARFRPLATMLLVPLAAVGLLSTKRLRSSPTRATAVSEICQCGY